MTVRIEKISQRTFTVKITATHVADGAATDRTAFTAVLTSVAMDSVSGQAVPLPEATRSALEKYLSAQLD
jgi:acyl-CoA thioesterase FadM